MVVNKASDDEILIEKMKDIRSIDYDDVFLPDSDGKNKIFPGFIVFFRDSSLLHLNTNSPYFEKFVRRLKEVYLEEKDHVVSSSFFGPKKIEISPLAKEILLSGDLERTSTFYQEYQDKEGYQESLFFEEDEVHSIFHMIDYHLRLVLKDFDITIDDAIISHGNNGCYYISTKIHNKPILLPMMISLKENDYEILIGNLFDRAISIRMEFSFRKDSIHVHNSIPEYQYYDFCDYSVSGEIPDMCREVYLNDKCISYNRNHLEKIDEVPENILSKDDNTVWYVTPWNGYIGVSQNEEKIEDGYILTRYFYYVLRDVDHYYEQERDSKQFYKKMAIDTYYDPIVFDSMSRKIVGVRSDNVLLFEDSFYDSLKTGFYREHLLNHFFYSVSNADSWSMVNHKNQFYFKKENGVEEKTDLYNQKIIEKRMSENGLI